MTKRNERAVESVGEAMGAQLGSEILSLEELRDFPDIRNESERNQLVMAAVACGYSQPFIARAFKVSQPSINEVIRRIDPDGMFKISPNGKKALMTRMYEMRGMEALASITPEKLEDASARDLASIAKTCSDASMSLNQSKHKEIGASRLDNMLKALEMEAGGAPYDEV